jgi:hypothetical protein
VWDDLGGVERELQRDGDARGVADDVRPLDAQLAHEEPAVLGVIRHGHRPIDCAAAAEAGAVVCEQAVAGEGGLVEERLDPGRAHAPVNEDDGLAGAPQRVLQLDPVDGDSFLQLHGGFLQLAK